MKILITVLLTLICFNIYAKKGPVTNLELPRFVSLKSNDVNLRVGPSVNYPIELKYTQNNLPVEIIDEFDVWRKIKDYKNNTGWLHKSLIKGERFVLIINLNNETKNIFSRPNGKKIGGIRNNNLLNLERCLLNWCLISHEDIRGWLSKEFVWGVYKSEIYNKSFYQPIINLYWKFLDKIENNNFLNNTKIN